jgi:hypothetical protein
MSDGTRPAEAKLKAITLPFIDYGTVGDNLVDLVNTANSTVAGGFRNLAKYMNNLGITTDQYIELASADWNPSGVIVDLYAAYTAMPLVYVSLQIDGFSLNKGSELTVPIMFLPVMIMEDFTVNGVVVPCYSKVQVNIIGFTLPDTIENGKIAVTALCTGKIIKTAP